MTPEFEKVVDPLISNLLGIIQRSDRLTIHELTVELREELDRANLLMETDREWKYATYAIVAWVDSEIIINHNRWKDETLESHYFKTGNAYTEFFHRAESAYTKRYFNAFEVFYICFMFGYHGVYQTGDKTVVPKKLPMTDGEWQKQAAGRVSRIRKTRPSEKWVETIPDDWENAPLSGFTTFTNNVVLFSVVLIAAIVVVLLFTQT